MKQAIVPRDNFQPTIWGSWEYNPSLSYTSERKLTRSLVAMYDDASSRHLANFHSTVWGHHFLSYTSQLTEITTQEKQEQEELKEKVRNMLMETLDDSTQKLVLIDTIQRLGVAYHFHNEIETSIKNIFDTTMSQLNDDSLYVVALLIVMMVTIDGGGGYCDVTLLDVSSLRWWLTMVMVAEVVSGGDC
ncbi:putative 3-oxo-Delta(4,5)-steroid 5-beta-reductase-like [Capsicum annuum]|nr:putative 3-oxo-Delta(4,5)-steroid 5-beta-reductase-like [Capsicum annuum]